MQDLKPSHKLKLLVTVSGILPHLKSPRAENFSFHGIESLTKTCSLKVPIYLSIYIYKMKSFVLCTHTAAYMCDWICKTLQLKFTRILATLR